MHSPSSSAPAASSVHATSTSAPGRGAGKRHAIIVLGMHRSGTSVLTRVVNLLGADVPRNLYPALPSNPRGHWESTDLIALHDAILAANGMAYDDAAAFPAAWFDTPEAREYENRIIELLDRDFPSSDVFVLKDPRICRLMPLWLNVLERMGVEARFILPIRNPLEVAASLKSRNDFDQTKSLLLWLRHVVDAERGSRGQARGFLTYDTLLADWRAAMVKVGKDLGFAWPRGIEEAGAEIDGEVSSDYRNHSTRDDAPQLAPGTWVGDGYRAAVAAAQQGDGEAVRRVFDRVSQEMATADREVGPLLIAFQEQLAASRREIEALAARPPQPAAEPPPAPPRPPARSSLSGALRRRVGRWLRRVPAEDRAAVEASGLFDADWYRARYPDVAAAGIEPLTHYLRHGWRERRQPNPLFDTGFYLDSHPDVAAAEIEPLLHFVRSGAAERRHPHPLFHTGWYVERHPEAGAGNPLAHYLREGAARRLPTHPAFESFAAQDGTAAPSLLEIAGETAGDGLARFRHVVAATLARRTATERLVFVAHDGSRTGAPLVLLRIVERLAQIEGVACTVLMRNCGELEAEFRRHADVLNVAVLRSSFPDAPDPLPEVARLLAADGAKLALCNTVVASDHAEALDRAGIPVLSYVHELPASLEVFYGRRPMEQVAAHSKLILTVSDFARTRLTERFGLDPARVRAVHFGIEPGRFAGENRERARERIRRELGLPEDAFLVLGCGSVDPRKGTDLFIGMARALVRRHGLGDAHFVWLGEGKAEFTDWCRFDIAASGLEGRVHLLGRREDPRPYYLAADLFVLPSREDPFPLVVLEAMAAGLPVVAFDTGGGAAEAIGTDAGMLARNFETDSLRAAVLTLYRDAVKRADMGSAARRRVARAFTFDRFMGDFARLLHAEFAVALPGPLSGRDGTSVPDEAPTHPAADAWYDAEAPEVSIVVLNFNKADYTAACLDSVWRHTTGHRYEVIVVDNGSAAADFARLTAVRGRFELVRLEHNRFFGEGNNVGAQRAKGAFVLFLNNDTLVTADWLAPLMDTFARHADAGSVGAKLVFPDGRLQEAGALLRPDGTAEQLGKFGDPDDPAFNQERVVDYCSAAAVLVRKAVFERVLGFDLCWEPVHYEDADLCLKIELLDLKNYYCPHSTVVHIENGTSREGRFGLKLHNTVDINRGKFLARWGGYLASGKTERPVLFGAAAPALPKTAPGRKRAAVYTPYPLLPGGGERYALTIAEAWAKDHDVTLLTLGVYSRLRLLTLAREFALDLDAVTLLPVHEAQASEPFDLYAAVGNEVLPQFPGRGRRNFYHCQFPFPLAAAEAAHRWPWRHDYERVVVNSSFTQGHVRARLAALGLDDLPVDVVHPPADMMAPEDASAGRRDNLIVSVGRFFAGGHCKRQDLMIEAFRSLVERSAQPVELHLVGALLPEPEHRDYYLSLVERAAGLPVFFHLNAAPAELQALYRRAGIYWHATGADVDPALHPERCEHFGITIVEAMSAGCIPVVADCGGPVEIVTEGESGFRFTSLEALRDRTQRLVDGRDEPWVAAMRARAAHDARAYAKDVFAAKWQALAED
jgi:glycosyltransferase involved in cell wall biosynthesis/GT2 family glycosyltransferase